MGSSLLALNLYMGVGPCPSQRIRLDTPGAERRIRLLKRDRIASCSQVHRTADPHRQPESIERGLAINAHSDAFPAQLIMTTGLGAYLINANAFGPGLACLGVTVLGIAWFWIRYGRLLSRA
mgnify:CR=1 FL=1